MLVLCKFLVKLIRVQVGKIMGPFNCKIKKNFAGEINGIKEDKKVIGGMLVHTQNL